MTNSLPFSKSKFAALGLSLLGLLPCLALAQVNGSFNAAATVVQPLTITSTSTLNFGSFVAGATAGSVIVSSSGTYTRSATGGVKLVNSNNGSFSTINVSGAVGTNYWINTLPADVKLINSTGGATMTISSFTTNLPSGTARASITDSGNGSFQIGGTLEVGINQPSGIYSAVIPITVNYE